MTDTNRRVQHVIDAFVTQLTQIAREEAARVVLGGFGPIKGIANHARASGRGEKRSHESLEGLQEKLRGYIAKHPGLRVEEINRALGTNTKDLALPIRKLIASKSIRTIGQRRATKYFAGGEKAAKGAKKSRKKTKK